MLLVAVFFTGIMFAQNKSNGVVQTTITSPSPLSGETFRFNTGLVTQLDSGSSFGFTSDRWFSIGRLFTGSQTVYGLRFQLPNRAITMGYQDLNDANPRIQWIGASNFAGSDLEFRTANSFTSTASTLVATMNDRGNTFFGNPLSTNTTRVGVDYGNIGSTRTGVTVDNVSTVNAYIATGFKSINQIGGYRKIGLDVQSSSTPNNTYDNIGVNISLGGAALSSGVRANVSGTDSGTMYGVYGAISTVGTPTGFGAGIYGKSIISPNRFAGYFDGNVFTTGAYLPSDEKLKENIKAESNALDKLSQLETVTYTFKENEHLNLPTKLQHGFLAQNLEKVFPELITTINKPIFDKNDTMKQVGTFDYKAVNYIGLISVLTSSLKELQETSEANLQQVKEESAATIEKLREESAEKMDALNAKIEVLEAKLEALTGEASSSEPAKPAIQNNTSGFSMEQNKPNPFTNQTVINYTLPKNTNAVISVVDLSGKFIKEYNLSSEKGQVTINASEIGKGMFIYSLVSGGEIMVTKKMIVK